MKNRIEQSIEICVPANKVWDEIIDLDISSFHHPRFLKLLGVPKPLFAELENPGPSGRRVARFANGRTFVQEVTRWEPFSRFEFTFCAQQGFRVGYFLDLENGPFQMKSGAYRIEELEKGTRLYLASDYELNGFFGVLLSLPVRMVLFFFQRYLLNGIRKNLETTNG